MVILLAVALTCVQDFDKLSFESRLLLNTSHITPQQAGHLLSRIKARLPVIHHLTVSQASCTCVPFCPLPSNQVGSPNCLNGLQLTCRH